MAAHRVAAAPAASASRAAVAAAVSAHSTPRAVLAAAARPAPRASIVPSVTISDDTLTITDDNNAHTLSLTADPNTPSILHFVTDNGTSQDFTRGQFSSVVIDANGGDDTVTLGNGLADLQIRIFGGAGND